MEKNLSEAEEVWLTRDVTSGGAIKTKINYSSIESYNNSASTTNYYRTQRFVLMFAEMMKYKVWRKRLHCEIQPIRTRLEQIVNANDEFVLRLRQAQSQAENRYLQTLSKYDKEMRILHRKRKDLEALRNSVREVHINTKAQLILQRIEYRTAKREWAGLVENAIAESLEEFQRHRAARIIQRHWKACSCRVLARRRRWRK